MQRLRDLAPTTTAVPFATRLGDYDDRPALITAGSTITYRELADRVADTAERLGTARRLVLVTGANAVEPIVAYLAALAAGHPVLVVPGDNRHTLDAMIAAYDPDVTVSHVGGTWDLHERHVDSAHDLHPELALLLGTSGSTGSPKLVRLSHENVQANAEAIAEYLGIAGTDRAATTLPMHYCYGLSVLNSHLLRGAGLILTDLSVVDRCFWDLFRAERGTTFAGVPYTFDQLDRIGFDRMHLPSLRYVTQAGGRLGPDRVRRYAELGRRDGWDLVVMYGQTEATARMAYVPPRLAAAHPNVIGRPIPGGSFTLLSAGDASDPDVGELVYAGPNVMLGYAERPGDLGLGRTVDVLHTGDLARLDASGMYEIVGRRSRIAKIFGLRIDLQQVEAVLAEHGITAWCADGGDELIVATAGDDTEAVRRFAREHFGLPRWAVMTFTIGEPPRLATGKPDYRGLVTLAHMERTAGETAPEPTSRAITTTADLRELYARLLNRDDVTDESTFVSLDGDSLSYVEMSIQLEDALGTLPANWHTTPISELSPAPRQRRTGWRQIETNVLIRAAAIVAIVGTHANLFTILGGAHALLGIAGYNFARFHLTAAGRRERIGHVATSVARVALPSMIWIAGAAALSEKYTLANALLLNGFLGPDRWSSQWHYWFIEVIVYTLLGLALVLAVPLVDRIERGSPFWFAVALMGVGLLTRYEIVGFGDGPRLGVAHIIFWLFTIGWAAAKASSRWHLVLVSALIALTIPGFFGNPARDAVVIGALLLLVWIPSVRVPATLARLSGVLASSSLYIYLTHWLVYPYLDDYSALLAVVGSVIVGVGYWKVASFVMGGRARYGRRERASTG